MRIADWKSYSRFFEHPRRLILISVLAAVCHSLLTDRRVVQHAQRVYVLNAGQLTAI